MNRLIALVLLLVNTPLFAQSPSEFAAALAGDDHEDAASALIALEPEASIPALVPIFGGDDPEHSWRASMVLVRIASAKPKAKYWTTCAAQLTTLAADETVPQEGRVLTALSVRALGKAAKDQVSDLANLLLTEQPLEVQLATALGLGGLKSVAAKELGKQLKKTEGLLRLFWTTTSLACMGEEGKAAKVPLARLIEDEKRISAFLTCRSAHFALTATSGERVATRALDKRCKNEKGKRWGKGYRGRNFGALRKQPVFEFFKAHSILSNGPEESGLPPIPQLEEELEEWSLPKSFPDPFSGGEYSYGDGICALALHLTGELSSVSEQLEQRKFSSWAELQERLAPIMKTLTFVAEADPYTRPD